MQGRGASTCPSDHECTEVVAWKVRIQKIVRYLEDWCCQTGLNCRPLHYQWSALPLSYGSMAGTVRIGPKRPLQAGGSCHKAPSGASARRGREGAKMGKNQCEPSACCRNRVNSGPIRFPLPSHGACKGAER